EVERTRIEQLENQLRQLRAQAERLAGERLSLGAQEGGPQLGQLALEESDARRASERCAGAHAEAQARVQALRTAQLGCVERLEELSGALAGLAAGRLTLVESGERACGAEAKTLAAHVKGPPAVIARLAAVSTAESLGKALAARGALVDGRSFITAAGEWV